MPNIGSNNPFRNSFVAAEDDNNTPTRSLPPPSQPLRRSPSTTTTIMEEDENEPSSQQRQQVGMTSSTRSSSPSPVPPPTPPPTGPLPAIPLNEPETAYIIDANKNKSPSTANGTGDGHILITIQSADSKATTPPHTGTLPTHRLSIDPVVQNRCTMWPALRLAQKSRIKSKRTWIIIKVTIALVIIVGAVAVGLGISKAVNNARQKS